MQARLKLVRANWTSSFLGRAFQRYSEVTSFTFFRIVQIILIYYSGWRFVSYLFGDLHPLHPWPINWLDSYTRLGLWPGLCNGSWVVVGMLFAFCYLGFGWAKRQAVLFWIGVLFLFFTSFLPWI